MDAATAENCRRTTCSAKDAAFLCSLYISTREEEVQSWGWPSQQAQDFLRMQWMLQRHAYQAQYPNANDLLIVRDGNSVGRCLIDENATRIHLIDLAILPEYRGRGIGSLILQDLQRQASEHGVPLELSVSLDNPAQALYRRFGFTETARTQTHLAMQWQPVLVADHNSRHTYEGPENNNERPLYW